MATQYHLVTDRAEFAALRTHWNQLVSKCEVDHAFMRHEWFECWIGAFHTTGSLAVQTTWSDGQLVAAAPMRIALQKRRGVRLRVLQFLQSSITPRCNLIVDPRTDHSEFFDSLFAIPGWDIMELRSIEMEQPISQALIEYLRRKRDYTIETGVESPYEVLGGTWEAFCNSRPKRCRKSFRNSANRLRKAGTHEIVVLETPDDFQRHFQDLLGISARSWKTEGGTDLPSTPKQADFYRNFSNIGAAEGLCIAYLLYLNGNPIAFDYYLRHERRLAGIRWEYDAKYKYYMPGTVLHARVIKDLLNKGESWEYDLCGMPTEYKSGFVRSLRRHVDITVGRPGVRGKFLILSKKALIAMHKFGVTGHGFRGIMALRRGVESVMKER